MPTTVPRKPGSFDPDPHRPISTARPSAPAAPGRPISRRFAIVSTGLSILFSLVAITVVVLDRNGHWPQGRTGVHVYNAIAVTAKYPTPLLALAGVVLWYRGWRRTAEAVAADDSLAPPVERLRGTPIGLAWSIAALLGTSATALNVHADKYIFNYTADENCSWSTGNPAVCKIRIQNRSDSTVTFDWHAYSSPAGARFSPDSGSIEPGKDSPTVTATDPFICPITFVLEDTDHHLGYAYHYDKPCR